jgi:hypothetical protein
MFKKSAAPFETNDQELRFQNINLLTSWLSLRLILPARALRLFAETAALC